MKEIIAISCIILSLTFTLRAQDIDESKSFERKGFGLAASIQSTQLGILMPIWISEKTVFAPSIKYAAGENLGSDVAFGLGFRFYTNEARFSPYITPSVIGFWSIPSKENKDAGSKAIIDFAGGLGFGGEYFLSRHFSSAVEAGLNVTSSNSRSDRFGNAGNTNINTAASIIANAYF